MADLKSVDEGSFQEEVMEAGNIVLVDFWAPWCGYCQRLAPVLEELAAEMGETVKIVKVNVDENRGLAQQNKVMSLPTMLLFKNGEVVERLMGYMPKDNISAKIKPLI